APTYAPSPTCTQEDSAGLLRRLVLPQVGPGRPTPDAPHRGGDLQRVGDLEAEAEVRRVRGQADAEHAHQGGAGAQGVGHAQAQGGRVGVGADQLGPLAAVVAGARTRVEAVVVGDAQAGALVEGERDPGAKLEAAAEPDLARVHRGRVVVDV